jgi:hypothetical protein
MSTIAVVIVISGVVLLLLPLLIWWAYAEAESHRRARQKTRVDLHRIRRELDVRAQMRLDAQALRREMRDGRYLKGRADGSTGAEDDPGSLVTRRHPR